MILALLSLNIYINLLFFLMLLDYVLYMTAISWMGEGASCYES